MRPAVSYILHDTSYHEKTGNIITFAQFEEDYLVENKRNTEEDESILSSIDELFADNDSDDGYISMNALEDIQDRSQIHPDINVRYALLKIRDHIKQTEIEWKGA